MTKVLFIKGNPKKTEQSYSLRLGQAYVDAYKAAHTDAEISELDLYEDHIPLIDGDVMTGKLAHWAAPTVRRSMSLSAMSHRMETQTATFWFS